MNSPYPVLDASHIIAAIKTIRTLSERPDYESPVFSAVRRVGLKDAKDFVEAIMNLGRQRERGVIKQELALERVERERIERDVRAFNGAQTTGLFTPGVDRVSPFSGTFTPVGPTAPFDDTLSSQINALARRVAALEKRVG